MKKRWGDGENGRHGGQENDKEIGGWRDGERGDSEIGRGKNKAGDFSPARGSSILFDIFSDILILVGD